MISKKSMKYLAKKYLIKEAEISEKQYFQQHGAINFYSNYDESGERRNDIFVLPAAEADKFIDRFINMEAEENYYDYSPTGLWFGGCAERIEKAAAGLVIIKKPYRLDC